MEALCSPETPVFHSQPDVTSRKSWFSIEGDFRQKQFIELHAPYCRITEQKFMFMSQPKPLLRHDKRSSSRKWWCCANTQCCLLDIRVHTGATLARLYLLYFSLIYALTFIEQYIQCVLNFFAVPPPPPSYRYLTLILLTWTIWRAPTNASKWRVGFNPYPANVDNMASSYQC